jgi:diguanylate cyclase (GGDEF)-like protein
MLSPAYLILSPAFSNLWLTHAAVGVSQLLRICSAILFLWSGDLYRQTRYLRPPWEKLLFPLAAWFLLAPVAFGEAAVLAPGFLINAVLMAGAALMYGKILADRRMVGAGLTALVLIGFSITNVTAALTSAGAVQTSSDLFLLNAVLSIMSAIGIHLLVFEDMTYEIRLTNRRLETAKEELVRAATTDPLTGCHNRRFLEQVMDRELQRHDRFSLPLSLLFIDVNRFKAVNDTLGHDAGDRLLQYVARFLKRHIREADYVFRWGGDEFLVLITCVEEEARQKAAALKAAFEAAPEAVDLPPGIGLSVGVVEVPRGIRNLLPLVHEGDVRMYRDKGARPSDRETADDAAPPVRRRKQSSSPR